MTTILARDTLQSEMEPSAKAVTPASARPHYNVAIGYLRAFVRLLVFALHSTIAYYPGPFPGPPPVRQMSIPVTDATHFAGSRILVAFNEITAMSLMFFLSGLFLWPSLSKKGAGAFLRERTQRLWLPFLASGGLVAALAYYPAYLQSAGSRASLGDYFTNWMSFAHWITGPAWFLLVLFAYDLAAIGLFVCAPDRGRRFGALAQTSATKPLRFFLVVVALSMAAYVPLAVAFGPYDWWHIGPFWLQKCRSLQYGAYFFLGAAVGASGLSVGLVSAGGALARNWKAWAAAMVATFLVVANMEQKTISSHVDETLLWGTVVGAGWVICCAVCSFALIAIFVTLARRNRVLDNFTNNSYGMYLVHYPFVTWTQFALLSVPLSPILKAVCVLAVAVCGAWATTAALRRIPAVARTI
jgi:peptidoglycan/LPS O-acetylase OafA/YrhL